MLVRGPSVFAILILECVFPGALAGSPAPDPAKVYLRDNWALQSSCKFKAAGEQISAPGFRTDGWHSATVPSTVVGALVADKTYPDPTFGMNLRSIPGANYPIGDNFGELAMPPDSPFRCSWWYRTEFRPPENFKNRRVSLDFSGINYRANIWLNGKKLADSTDVVGMFRTYEFDVTPDISTDKQNALAVEVFAQTENDLGINWQDWNPAPPDKDMGLFGDVTLSSSGSVAIRHPQVVTHFPNDSLDVAELTVIAELHNLSAGQVEGSVDGSAAGAQFRQTYILKPGETRIVRLSPQQFPQLRIQNPKLWWPAPLGPQNLHELSLRFVVDNDTSDEQKIRFGIREITSEVNEHGARQFRVNGKNILIRGGGWARDMLLRQPREKLDAELCYVRDMNLNTIRFEGQFETEDLFNLADERGILIMPGWTCCVYWQLWPKWSLRDLEIATESLRSQALLLRRHPSVFVWLNASDVPPPPVVEKAYLEVLQETDWPNPVVSSAAGYPTTVTGPSGMKMGGPYDYVPPSYWLTDPGQYGGAWRLNSETSPGPAIPTVGSLKKMFPPDRLWPINPAWSFHTPSPKDFTLNRINTAMDSMFGAPKDLERYVELSQAMAYDGERAMFEAFARNRYKSSGVIQWMLNNAWPSLYWHLYDYYLQPAGGYFGTKKACEPVHIQYSYDDRSIVVTNGLYEKFSKLSASAELYDFDLRKTFSQQASLDLGPDSLQRVFTIPALPAGAQAAVYFLKLTLRDSSGRLLSSNFYWLTTHPAQIEWKKTVYFDDPVPADTTYSTSIYTPASRYDDLTQLTRLPRARLTATASAGAAGRGPIVRVNVKNPSDHLAFQIRLAIHQKGSDAEILPVLWEDNYFELLPGEAREISAEYLSPDALKGNPELTVSGWNIDSVTIPLATPAATAPSAHGGGN
jgi:exo-1,4-beta-D-glucosaminidase